MRPTVHRVPSGWNKRHRNNRGEAVGQASVSDLETGGMRYIFVRLAPRASEERLIRSFEKEATVDLDEDGNIMGIKVAWMDQE